MMVLLRLSASKLEEYALKRGSCTVRYLHPIGELEEQAREEARGLFQFANVKKAPEAPQALLEVERLPGGGGQCLSISQHLGTAGAWGEVHKGAGVGGVGLGSGAWRAAGVSRATCQRGNGVNTLWT